MGELRAGVVQSLEGCQGEGKGAEKDHRLERGRCGGRFGVQYGRREQRMCNMVVLHQCSQLDGVSSPSTFFFSFF